MIQWFRSAILQMLTPVTRDIGKVQLPHHEITSKDYRDIKELLKPGMIFLTRTNWALSNMFIPGAYKHGAMFFGENTVVEAIGEGVVKTDLIDFLLTKDNVRVMTPIFADLHEMADAAAFAGTLVGRPYDYQFRSNNKAFYCFEVVYAAYREARVKRQTREENVPVVDWDLRKFWGEDTVVGDDFLRAISKWATIWVR